MNLKEKIAIQNRVRSKGEFHSSLPAKDIVASYMPTFLGYPAEDETTKSIAHTRLKGELHSSRGQRPRWIPTRSFCPVRANQNPAFSGTYATIIAYPQCTHHFLNKRAAPLADEGHSFASLGLSIPKISRGIRRTLFVGLRRFWSALSGLDGLFFQLPRALPSARMVKGSALNLPSHGVKASVSSLRSSDLTLLPSILYSTCERQQL